MKVRVVLESLPPGVEHTEETNLRAQMLGIGRDLQQGFGAGLKEQLVDDLLIVERQPREFMRQGEHHVEIADVQQFLLPVRQPAVASVSEALRAVPIAARVIRDGAMAAPRATVQMAAERCRAAMLDSAQHLQLLPCQPGTVALDEVLTVLSNDIGHLEGGPIHFLCFLRDRRTVSGLETLMVSSGLGTACKCRRERCR